MKCPKCGRWMTLGAPHTDYPCRQWECRCGYITLEALKGGKYLLTKDELELLWGDYEKKMSNIPWEVFVARAQLQKAIPIISANGRRQTANLIKRYQKRYCRAEKSYSSPYDALLKEIEAER